MATGTISFLFTDIEGSTQRWDADRASMSDALRAHDALISAVVEAGGGQVFKHTGDGVCAAFDAAHAAVGAAIELQRELALPVRMGLHTGDADERDGDYFGPTLNTCARIMDSGHGGQILCSAATRALLDDAAHVEAPLVDLGPHELKGIARPVAIFQVGAGRFPELRTVERTKRLPTALTSLVGRDALVEEVVAALDGGRLATVVGVGGVGKTRVAIAAAHQLAARFDSVVFVDLTEVSDDADVPAAVAGALDVTTPTVDAITISLSTRPTLLVLDNCEHVLDGAADVVERVLLDSRSTSILATSREGLAIDGERLVTAPGLATDGADSAAVRMFIDRVPSGGSETIGPDDVEVITEICRRLDGLPLAIELAAARIGVLSPSDLLGRLDERFGILTGGRRRRSRDRQRTLRDAIDWSYDLLTPDDRTAFALLSVFAGSFGLDGAVAVLDSDDENGVLDTVEALVDKSLLTATDVEGLRRYRYLETIRSYAEDRLVEHGHTEAAAARMHDHLVAVVHGAAEDLLQGPSRGAVRLRAEVPNLRRAFEAALDLDDVARATALIAPLGELAYSIDWRFRGWADEALALGSAAHDRQGRLALLILSGADSWLDQRYADTRRVLSTLVEEASTEDDVPSDVYSSASRLSGLIGDMAALSRWGAPAAASTHDEDRRIFKLLDLYVHWFVPSPPDARPTLPVGVDVDADIDRAIDHPSPIIRCKGYWGAALRAYAASDFDTMLERALLAADLGIVGSANRFAALQTTAWARYLAGDLAGAVRDADVDLDEAHRYADRSAMIIPTAVYAMVLKELDLVDAAATLRGALPRRLTLMMVAELVELDRWLEGQLDAERRAVLAAEGAAMSRRELQALAHRSMAGLLAVDPPAESPAAGSAC